MKVLDLIEHMPALRHLLACTRWTGSQWCPDFLVNRMAWCDGCRAREIELPKLLDELRAKVTALEGGIVAENIRTNAVIGETNALLKEYQIESDETLRDVVERLTSALKRTMSERDECMRKLSIAYTRDADAIAVLQTALGVQPKGLVEYCHEAVLRLERSTEERAVLQARVAALEVWYSVQPVRADDDPSLTCVLCNGVNCEFTIQTSNGGTKYWYGIHKACRAQARDRGVSPTPEISVAARTVLIKTWRTERGWSASEDDLKFFHIEAEGGETARKAADNVIGAIMIALGQREHPPYNLRFVVRREEKTQ